MGYNTEKVLEELQNLKDTQKYFYDRNSKPLKPLEIGDTVRLRNPGQPIKTPGKVVRPAETPKSYFVSHGNTTLRRNRRDLIKTKKRNTEQQEDTKESTESENCSFPNNSTYFSLSVNMCRYQSKFIYNPKIYLGLI